jgi:hypothetical protein
MLYWLPDLKFQKSEGAPPAEELCTRVLQSTIDRRLAVPRERILHDRQADVDFASVLLIGHIVS